MAQRGVDVSYVTIRMWTRKFGRIFAHNLQKIKSGPFCPLASRQDGSEDWWGENVSVVVLPRVSSASGSRSCGFPFECNR